jgi:hypothetical protein
MKKQICCLLDYSLRPGSCAAPSYDHIVIDAQRDPEAIEARTEIGSAGRNANGNLLHRSAPPQRGARRRSTMMECNDSRSGRQPIRCAMPIRKYAVKGQRDR